MKNLTICADDYSQSPSISAAILRLLETRRLNAVSCFSQSPTWPFDARNLFPFLDRAQIGLHFNLTFPFGQSKIKVSRLLFQSIADRISSQWVKVRLTDQWNAFEKSFGRSPDFIDGHQHVHVFPVIRDAVTDFIQERSPNAWIRTLTTPPNNSTELLKQRLLSHMSQSLSEQIARKELKTNAFFQGFRNYNRPQRAPESFNKWFDRSPDGTLIMCHPGMISRDLSDPIRKSRHEEFDYLLSPNFLQHLFHADATLSIPDGHGF